MDASSGGAPAPASSGSTTQTSQQSNQSQTGAAKGGSATQTATPKGAIGSQASGPQPGESSKSKAAAHGEATETPAPANDWKLEGELDIYGNKVKVEYGSKEEALRELQRGRAALTKLEKAARLEKETAEFIKQLKSDPAAALQMLGVDFEQVAQKTVAQRAQEAMMTEEQKALAQAQREAQEYRSRLEQIEQERQQQAIQEYEQKTWAEMEPKFLQAFEQRGIARDPTSFEDLALIGKKWTELGLDFSPEQIVDEVHRKHMTIFQNRWQGIRLNPQAVAGMLGEDGLAALNKYQAEKWKASQNFGRKPTEELAPVEPQKKQEYRSLTAAELLARLPRE